MIIYEVNADVSGDNSQAFLDWIDDHISTVLAAAPICRGVLFEERSITDLKKPTHRYVIQYEFTKEENLKDYLDNVAPDLRKDSESRFGDDVQFSRRALYARPKQLD